MNFRSGGNGNSSKKQKTSGSIVKEVELKLIEDSIQRGMKQSTVATEKKHREKSSIDRTKAILALRQALQKIQVGNRRGAGPALMGARHVPEGNIAF